MTDLRHRIARALVEVTNRWISPNFPEGHKLRTFDELDEQEQRLNLDYADAAMKLLPDLPQTAPVVAEIAAERERQVNKEGWSLEHDDQHTDESLAMAAALYAAPTPLHRIIQRENGVAWVDPWPWQNTFTYHRYGDGDPTYRVPDGDKRLSHDRRRRLVIAAALIIAEVERLDRLALSRPSQGGGHDAR